ncbi:MULTISPECIES: HAD family hydrolase [Campylobacter]|uniref:HAD hydrolase family protein n=1 Tax=Campylobacter TaxID=194 RepID=UPI000707652F|nr:MULTISPECIES: HAD hydrolase family protein [Campylobacter]EAI3127585.1 capsular biosynthesis protein [Campylobacter coli]HDZ5244770.1 HAD hydrolase family protein [Campylobacter jejuni]EAH7838114.1 capsular biosynthesis protein [Campylobacter lari]EAI2016501.1 capsular biosynthesis protein [Campylobacter lari]EAI2082404.1 capsular biosynthesis protein [Campylobacter lari]
MKQLVIDLDGTLTLDVDSSYKDKPINTDVLEQLCYYKDLGFKITIFTSRNMRTYQGDVRNIRQNTLPIIIEWLDKHKVPYDDIVIGKPWCGFDGFYVDDKAIRPSEFIKYSYNEIIELLQRENPYKDGGNK